MPSSVHSLPSWLTSTSLCPWIHPHSTWLRMFQWFVASFFMSALGALWSVLKYCTSTLFNWDNRYLMKVGKGEREGRRNWAQSSRRTFPGRSLFRLEQRVWGWREPENGESSQHRLSLTACQAQQQTRWAVLSHMDPCHPDTVTCPKGLLSIMRNEPQKYFGKQAVLNCQIILCSGVAGEAQLL